MTPEELAAAEAEVTLLERRVLWDPRWRPWPGALKMLREYIRFRREVFRGEHMMHYVRARRAEEQAEEANKKEPT